MRTKYSKAQTGISAQDTVVTPPADQVPACQRHKVVVEFGVGTTAGTFLVEEASSPDYAGTWVTLATIAWAAASKAGSASVDQVCQALRVRCSVAVANGTAKVAIEGLG